MRYTSNIDTLCTQTSSKYCFSLLPCPSIVEKNLSKCGLGNQNGISTYCGARCQHMPRGRERGVLNVFSLAAREETVVCIIVVLSTGTTQRYPLNIGRAFFLELVSNGCLKIESISFTPSPIQLCGLASFILWYTPIYCSKISSRQNPEVSCNMQIVKFPQTTIMQGTSSNVPDRIHAKTRSHCFLGGDAVNIFTMF